MKVVFLGCTQDFGFGYGANITKIGYMIKGLRQEGVDCVVHNGLNGSEKLSKDQRVRYNEVDVVSYSLRKPHHLSWFLNISKLFRFLYNEKVKGDNNLVILELDLFYIMFTYYLISHILGYKVVTISHEWGSIVKSLNAPRHISHVIFENTFGYFSDGILPISEYIIKKVEHFKKPLYKLPVLADFKLTLSEEVKSSESFVYCASASYFRIVSLVIDAFVAYRKNGGTLHLTLVLSGPIGDVEKVRSYIASFSLGSNAIAVKTKLPYDELFREYRSAVALLIPLDPSNEQDKARFSQKIAEYLSSKSPIVTNNVGEVNYYFNDDVIKCDFSIDGFAITFDWIEKNREICRKIGENGFSSGLKYFDYRVHGRKMYEFFQKI